MSETRRHIPESVQPRPAGPLPPPRVWSDHARRAHRAACGEILHSTDVDVEPGLGLASAR
jgi:hypothetical protein